MFASLEAKLAIFGIIALVLAALCGVIYIQYRHNETLTANLAEASEADKVDQSTIASLQSQAKIAQQLQDQHNSELQVANQKIQQLQNQFLIKQSDLAKIAQNVQEAQTTMNLNLQSLFNLIKTDTDQSDLLKLQEGTQK